MTDQNPYDEPCLTPEEFQEVSTAWNTLHATLPTFGALLDRSEAVDCQALYDAFAQVSGVFDDLERAVMRAQQIRQLRGGLPEA